MIQTWQAVPVMGIPELDAHHREVVVLLNRLLHACNVGTGREEVASMLHFLTTRLEEHFQAEERLMSRLRFPETEEHHREHDRYLKKVTSLAEQAVRLPGSVQIVMQTGALMAELLIEHIHGKDRALSLFLQSRGAPC